VLKNGFIFLVSNEKDFKFFQRPLLGQQILKKLGATLVLLFFLIRGFFEVIRAGIVSVDQLLIAIKEIAKNIVVVDDQMKNVGGKTPCDFGRNLIILSTVVWENTDPAIKQRAEKEFALSFFRYIVEGLLNCGGVFGSNMD